MLRMTGISSTDAPNCHTVVIQWRHELRATLPLGGAFETRMAPPAAENTIMKIQTLVYAACGALLLFTPGLRAEDAAVASKLAKFPAAAAEALKKAAGNAKMERVSVEKDGKTTVYEAAFAEPGKAPREVSVTADGKLNAEEETVPLEKVPEAARKAIEAGAKGAKIERVNRISRANGGVTYEAAYVNKGKKTEVEFLADGKQKPEEK